jgi:disease resistance protein RPM1
MVESLRLGYDDLPVHLKTCLLYCSIFPTGYKIERHGLVRKWITQGFFPQGPEQNMEAAAEACLEELVSRGLLQPEPASSAGLPTLIISSRSRHHQQTSTYCTVHPMMRAFLLWRSKEANFATCLELPPHDCPPSYAAADAAGPLFVGFKAGPDTISASTVDGSSRARSIVVFGHSSSSRTHHPVLRLRHLGLKGMPIRVLPPEIGRLQNLETLNLSDTGVRELPKQIGKLHHL